MSPVVVPGSTQPRDAAISSVCLPLCRCLHTHKYIMLGEFDAHHPWSRVLWNLAKKFERDALGYKNKTEIQFADAAAEKRTLSKIE